MNPSSQIAQEKEFFDTHFAPFYRTEQVCLSRAASHKFTLECFDMAVSVWTVLYYRRICLYFAELYVGHELDEWLLRPEGWFDYFFGPEWMKGLNFIRNQIKFSVQET